jgi:hypothetical protein
MSKKCIAGEVIRGLDFSSAGQSRRYTPTPRAKSQPRLRPHPTPQSPHGAKAYGRRETIGGGEHGALALRLIALRGVRSTVAYARVRLVRPSTSARRCGGDGGSGGAGEMTVRIPGEGAMALSASSMRQSALEIRVFSWQAGSRVEVQLGELLLPLRDKARDGNKLVTGRWTLRASGGVVAPTAAQASGAIELELALAWTVPYATAAQALGIVEQRLHEHAPKLTAGLAPGAGAGELMQGRYNKEGILVGGLYRHLPDSPAADGGRAGAGIGVRGGDGARLGSGGVHFILGGRGPRPLGAGGKPPPISTSGLGPQTPSPAVLAANQLHFWRI